VKTEPSNAPANSLAKPLAELFETAKKTREHSYSPYSGAKVGAAIRLKNGKIFGGCNVENSSYGATICAERTAIQSAVASEGPKIEIVEIVVVTDANPPWPPCGLCRQVIAEFGQNSIIHSANLDSIQSTMSFRELYPLAFTPGHLGK
jgi:cytidine deaminase